MWHHVYILKNALGKQYIGSTEDLNARLREHNQGSVTATKNGRLWHIEWFCSFRYKKKAYDFERYLKSGSGSSIRYRHLVPE